MRKMKFTRRTPWLFTDLRKQPCPPGHFKTEDDLFHAYVDWLDYHDPIGFVRNWGVYRECEPEAEDLVVRVQHCKSAEEFAVELRKCLTTWFHPDDLKPHFLRRGFRAVAEDGWALGRRFEFDMQKNPAWVASRKKLARFRPLELDRLVTQHRLLHIDGVDCRLQWARKASPMGMLEFMATDVAGWTDAQLVEKARATGVIPDGAEFHVVRDHSEFVTLGFDRIAALHPDGAHVPGPYPRRKKRVRVIEVE